MRYLRAFDNWFLVQYGLFASWFAQKTYLSSRVLFQVITAFAVLVSCIELAVLRNPWYIGVPLVIVWIYTLDFYPYLPQNLFILLLTVSIVFFLGIDTVEMLVSFITTTDTLVQTISWLSQLTWAAFWFARRTPFIDPPMKREKFVAAPSRA